jgi:hypothetical protein
MSATASQSQAQFQLKRDELLTVINNAAALKEPQFLQHILKTWLAAFPGDLHVNYLFARSLMDEGKVSAALSIEEMLERADPEFAQLYELKHKGTSAQGILDTRSIANYHALTGRMLDDQQIPGWALVYRDARRSMDEHQPEEAEALIQQALIVDPSQPLPAVLHLRIVASGGDTQTLENLANLYHARWPDCLQFGYLLAHAQILNGNDTDAVSLLHSCVGRDAGGQVANRLWPQGNPYQSMWQDDLRIPITISIPGSVSSLLGWNQLAPSSAGPSASFGSSGAQLQSTDEPVTADDLSAYPSIASPAADLSASTAASVSFSSKEPLQPAADQTNAPADLPENPASAEPALQPRQAANPGQTPQKRSEPAGRPIPQAPMNAQPEDPKEIHAELERIATRLQVPGITSTDRRFPVYVVFTSRKGLIEQYGNQTAFVIDELMKQLVETIRKRAGWTAILFYADDASLTSHLGIQPAVYNDPWKLKLAVADLDKALSRKGEMIGSLLIVGGPEVVPFHMLPNPTDDADAEVASDNPYATTDENYFIPEWPVGRLPGGTGKDASIILRSLRQMIADHTSANAPTPWWRRLNLFAGFLSSFNRAAQPHVLINNRPAFGYTAAIWKQASSEVFRPIGDSQSLLTSPPLKTAQLSATGLFPARLNYFNLHGTADTADWYGQPDYSQSQRSPEYPVALTPRDIAENQSTAAVVFSEACYGTNILNKGEDDALSLKFLSSGTRAVAGSTCIAYGAISTPLIAADRLAVSFWKQMKEGKTAGEALRNAKITLAQDMNRAQGFLDGEDQKTLISFILLGDPLATITTSKSKNLHFVRQTYHGDFLTACETECQQLETGMLPSEVMTQVKSIVEKYLPGMRDANYTFSRVYMQGDKSLGNVDSVRQKNGRTVVTLRKSYQVANRHHHHFARLTVDKQGKVVKLAVSR